MDNEPLLNNDPAAVAATLQFILGGSCQPASKPGFAHALKLSYTTVDPKAFSFHNRTLSYRYSLQRPSPQQQQRPSAGFLMALMDELSTNACFAVGQPSAPGLSLHMETTLLSPLDDTASLDELLIHNEVTKLGKTISFTRTEFRDSSNNKILAIAAHTKYMPTGNWFLDLVFGSKFWFQLLANNDWLWKFSPKQYPEVPLDQVLESTLDINSNSQQHQASFCVTHDHSNPFGTMHGGCHAMLMERVAMEYLKTHQTNQSSSFSSETKVTLESIQIDYLSAAKVGTVLSISCDTIAMETAHTYLRVLIRRDNDGRILSDGKLKFVTQTTKRSKL